MDSSFTTVNIHEFSTGIKAERTADGSWISRGFTGRYMNVTLTQIPHTVERAIANRLFAVVEGTSSNQPAVIGRVVPGEPDWSVVAVIIRGWDDGGRPLSVYRYFLCEGAEGLWKILQWIEKYEQEKGYLPVFNPFDTRIVTSEEISRPPEIPSERLEQQYGHESMPIVLPWEYQLNFRLINKIAEIKAGEQPVSWAYNAEALENPWSFVLIHSASERAYKSFLQAKANPPKALMPAMLDEQALKSAIKSLINSFQVKSEAVFKIVGALGNEQITSEYWHRLFDAQGAKKALSQNLYSPQLVRLITLRAMVIPETLPEFLKWLKIEGGRQKPDSNQAISLKFQQALSPQFPPDQLAKGIKFILPQLLAEQITPEAVHWLLAARHSAWKSCQNVLANDVQADLDNLSSPQELSKLSSHSFSCGNQVWKKLINYLQIIRSRPSHYEPYYKPLAKLFEQIKKDKISAYFYQVSYGEVPKKIFTKAFSSDNLSSDPSHTFGLTLRRKLTIDEQIIKHFLVTLNFISEHKNHFFIILVLCLLSATFPYVLGQAKKLILQNVLPIISLKKTENDIEEPVNPGETPSNNATDTTEASTSTYIPEMSEELETIALKSFTQTSKAIQEIVKELVKDNELKPKFQKNQPTLPPQQQPTLPPQQQPILPPQQQPINKPEDQVANTIKEILEDSSLHYAGVIKQDEFLDENLAELKVKWVKSIYKYQTKKQLQADGIINYLPGKNQSTYEQLKADTKAHLIKKNN